MTPDLLNGVDHRVVLRGLTWADYERLLEIRDENAVPRLTYLEGELELISSSRRHEGIKKDIARLLEAYADERDIELDGFGSWTLKSESKERGLEPDECYILGDSADREIPDLAIEVEWTHGLLNKVAVYAGLGVRELWIWRNGRIDVNVLQGDGYVEAPRSALLPELDLDALVRHTQLPSQSRAVKAFRQWLRGRDDQPKAGV